MTKYVPDDHCDILEPEQIEVMTPLDASQRLARHDEATAKYTEAEADRKLAEQAFADAKLVHKDCVGAANTLAKEARELHAVAAAGEELTQITVAVVRDFRTNRQIHYRTDGAFDGTIVRERALTATEQQRTAKGTNHLVSQPTPEFGPVIAGVVENVLEEMSTADGFEELPPNAQICDMVRERGIEATNETIIAFIEAETKLVVVLEHFHYARSTPIGDVEITREWLIEDASAAEYGMTTDEIGSALDALVSADRLAEKDGVLTIPAPASAAPSELGKQILGYLVSKDLSLASIMTRFKKDGITVTKGEVRAELAALGSSGDVVQSADKTPKYGRTD
jgi:hypothetical protein